MLHAAERRHHAARHKQVNAAGATGGGMVAGVSRALAACAAALPAVPLCAWPNPFSPAAARAAAAVETARNLRRDQPLPNLIRLPRRCESSRKSYQPVEATANFSAKSGSV